MLAGRYQSAKRTDDRCACMSVCIDYIDRYQACGGWEQGEEEKGREERQRDRQTALDSSTGGGGGCGVGPGVGPRRGPEARSRLRLQATAVVRSDVVSSFAPSSWPLALS